MLQMTSLDQKSKLLNSIEIASPCSVPLSEMSGDDRTKFCDLCKENVYNISAMSSDEVIAFLIEKKSETPCVKFYKRSDGSLITDNCPVGLRKARERFIKLVASVLFAVGFTLLAQKVQAQGIIGAPVDPKYGQLNVVSNCNESSAKDIPMLATLWSVPITALFGAISQQRTKRRAIRWYRRGASRRVVNLLVKNKAMQLVLIAAIAPLVVFTMCTLFFQWQGL